MSKENRSKTLIKVGMKEATKCFDAHISLDEASYDGDISKVDEKDVEVVPDEVDDAQIEGSKPAGADTLADNEGQEVTNKEDDDQTSNPTDKKNMATGHHLDFKMVQSVTTRMFSPGVKRTSILRTTSPFIAFRGQAEYFSCIPLICSKIVRRCQTSTFTQMLLLLMD